MAHQLNATEEKILKSFELKAKEYKAKSKSFYKEAKEDSKGKDGQSQIKSWLKAVQAGNKTELKAISDEIEAEYKQKSQNVTTAADGGYLVPTAVEANIVEKLVIVAPLRQKMTVINNAPALLNVNSQILRPTTAWTAEEIAYAATKMTFDDNLIKAFKLTSIVPLTEEFEQDAIGADAIRGILENQIAQAMAQAENTAFITGDGTTRPYGFRNLTLTGAQTATSTLATLDYIKAKTLMRALTQANRMGSFFMGNDAIESKLDSIVDTTGRFMYDDSVKESNFGRLLGRDYINADEHVNNELWNINGRGYVITDVAGIRIDYGFATGDFEGGRRSLRVMRRTGGTPVLNECFAKLILT